MSRTGDRWRPDGVYLALESSGPVGSVAVARGGDVLARVFLTRSSEQASRMIPAVRKALSTVALSPQQLAGIVVGAGPGSFTGVRIAAATAKGLAHALGLPLWAFSSLACAALTDLVLPWGAGPDGWWADPTSAGSNVRYVLFDARGERVYGACYEVQGHALHERIPGHSSTVTELLAAEGLDGVAFVGDAALRHRERFDAVGHMVLGAPAGIPTADALLALLALDPDRPPLADPARWEPEYLKSSSAERERLAAQGSVRL